MAGNFIAGAIKHPGALTRKAKKAGESPLAFAKSHDSGNSQTAKQSRFAQFLNKVRPKGKGSKGGGKKSPVQRQADALVVAARACRGRFPRCNATER